MSHLAIAEVAEDISNDAAIERHMLSLSRRGMRKPTMRDRRQVLNRVTRYLDGTPLLDATAKQLDEWQLTLQEKSPQTVCTYTTHIQQFYVWALDEQLIVNDPARRLPKPKLRRRLPRPMDEDDMKRALNAARSLAIVTGSARIFVWLLLAGYCGLRAGEISRLKGSDFRRSEDGGAWLSVDGKGGYPRVVRVAPDLFVYVKPFLDKARRGPLFPTEKGAALSPNEVSKRTNAFLHDTVGIDDTFHSLRHRFATSLADLGADIRDVQAALGHASLNTTSLYLASNTRRGAASVDALAADLDGDLQWVRQGRRRSKEYQAATGRFDMKGALVRRELSTESNDSVEMVTGEYWSSRDSGDA